MQMISEYIRNLAVFLIFTSFINIILPSNKYEPYINLVLGIILIFVITTPLVGIITTIGGGSGDFFSDAALQYDRAVMAQRIDDAGQAQIDAILATYTQSLTEQLTRIVENHGFTLHHAEFSIDTQDSFGEILSMYVTISEDEMPPSFIRIDPVRIGIGINTRGEATQAEIAESPRIISLKNIISDFYNLSEDNIYIIKQ
ncbi:MAG: stage III sporulation protein AF [Defluviitaleaceae bacterium]|nr:stage III sporulation protein AF [Defluviitaleaceae bacterium]